jgi:hypothetical protein
MRSLDYDGRFLGDLSPSRHHPRIQKRLPLVEKAPLQGAR